MRISPAVYRTLLHSVNQDNTVLGYDLKKSDLVTFNLGGINMSEKYFSDPFKFDPGRFVKNGEFHKDDNLMSFGVGKRSCPGQILAVIEIFHFAKRILQ